VNSEEVGFESCIVKVDTLINTLKKIFFNKLGNMPDNIEQKIDSMNDDELDVIEQKIFDI